MGHGNHDSQEVAVLLLIIKLLPLFHLFKMVEDDGNTEQLSPKSGI